MDLRLKFAAFRSRQVGVGKVDNFLTLLAYLTRDALTTCRGGVQPKHSYEKPENEPSICILHSSILAKIEYFLNTVKFHTFLVSSLPLIMRIFLKSQ